MFESVEHENDNAQSPSGLEHVPANSNLATSLVMPREGGASSNHGLAITGSPAFTGDDG